MHTLRNQDRQCQTATAKTSDEAECRWPVEAHVVSRNFLEEVQRLKSDLSGVKSRCAPALEQTYASALLALALRVFSRRDFRYSITAGNNESVTTMMMTHSMCSSRSMPNRDLRMLPRK